MDDNGYLIPGISADFINTIETCWRDMGHKITRERFKWPNPNPDDVLEKIWEEYKNAYARHLWSDAPTLTGISTGDELEMVWKQLVEYVMNIEE